MWDESITVVNTYLADTLHGQAWYGQADMMTGKRTRTTFGALEAFFPALLCLSGDVERAARLEQLCFTMWNLNGIEPEQIDYTTMAVTAKQYYLRPEIIESAYYLYHYTSDPKYLKMGEAFYRGLLHYCRTDEAYAYLNDVILKQKGDGMESFFFAETLKYLYLLFAPKDLLPFDKIIFTTEAHPIRRTWE